MGGLQSLSLKSAISGEGGLTQSYSWRASENVTDTPEYKDHYRINVKVGLDKGQQSWKMAWKCHENRVLCKISDASEKNKIKKKHNT